MPPEVNTNPGEASVGKKRTRTGGVTILEEEDTEENDISFIHKIKKIGNTSEQTQTASETTTLPPRPKEEQVNLASYLYFIHVGKWWFSLFWKHVGTTSESYHHQPIETYNTIEDPSLKYVTPSYHTQPIDPSINLRSYASNVGVIDQEEPVGGIILEFVMVNNNNSNNKSPSIPTPTNQQARVKVPESLMRTSPPEGTLMHAYVEGTLHVRISLTWRFSRANSLFSDSRILFCWKR